MKSIYETIDLTAEQILAISENAPERLFSGDPAIARREYYDLSRRWHPDRNRDSRATAVFQRVTELHRRAQQSIKAGRWRGAGILVLPVPLPGAGAMAGARQIKYFKRVEFELGDLFIAEKEVAFSVERRYADLFETARRRIEGFRFANAAMRKEIARALPRRPEFHTAADRLIMVLPKDPDAILLEDLLEHLGGALDARHVGWIVNRLYNLACYLDYAGVVHHDIGPRAFFVSPRFHSGALLGGWWYARARGESLKALPRRTIDCAPPDLTRLRRADLRADLELIRQTGRELLGAVNTMPTNMNGKIPPAMARWINGATSGSAVTDYRLWKGVLEMDFGAPRFVRLDVEPDAIYGKRSRDSLI
ncbi:MAG TPA: J domain-containing protein [Pyrinomonadaceae bacterium]|jgi:hypothetical protein